MQMIADPDIGLASLAEAEAIALLSREEIEYGFRWSWTASRVRRSIQDGHTNVVVVRKGALVVGFALMRYEQEHAHLLLLAVARPCRRRGVATALIFWLEETMRVAGIATVQVELRASNSGPRAFYEKLGFEQVDATARYYQGLETALHMVKELASGAT